MRGAKTNGIGLYVDGRVVSRDRSAPYTVRWNSHKAHDGRHWVTLAAVADRRTRGETAAAARRREPRRAKAVPKPKPKPKPLPATEVTAQNLADGQTVSGLSTGGRTRSGRSRESNSCVDGTVIATVTTEPWATAWDSSTAAPGAHALEVRAFTKDGRKAVLTIAVTSSG